MISLSIERGVARLSITRGDVRNALDGAGWRKLADAVQDATKENARVLILMSGVEGCFSAGSHLEELAKLVEDEQGRVPFRQMMRAALDPLQSLAIPAIAAIDGDCFGAGVALALACDIRIAGAKARFGVPPARLGVSYPPQDVARLVEAVGRGHAARLLYAAETVDGAEALRIGLVEKSAASALEEAERIAAAIAGNAPQSVAVLKRLVNGEAGMEEGDRAFDALLGGDAVREGINAFRERRAPRF